MPRILMFSLCCSAIVLAGGTHAEDIPSSRAIEVASNSEFSEGPCDLYQGDLGAEIGASGSDCHGPVSVAVNVTWPHPAPFFITSYYYNVFASTDPVFTMTFAVWLGAEVPMGSPIGSQTGLDVTQGYHTVPIVPAIEVNSNQFFFGAIQPQSHRSSPHRWGFDTSSGEGLGNSFWWYPGCGLSSWVTVTSVGFIGNWTMAVCVSGAVPVELESWGQIKTVWN